MQTRTRRSTTDFTCRTTFLTKPSQLRRVGVATASSNPCHGIWQGPTPVETGWGGHCLFKSLSWYLTGTNTNHEVMRALIINFARANSDIFVRAFKDKREFDHWLERKSSLPPRPSDLKSHWSSLLTGCICPFEPPFVALPQCEPWNLSGWPLTVLHIWVDLLLAMLMSQL